MRPTPLAALALLAASVMAVPALAQGGGHHGPYPGPGTALRLSETAEVTRAPDELRATLRAEARDPDPAAAQASVNRAMTAALEAARGVPGVVAVTGAYRTGRQEDPARWVASQTLSLRGGEPARLLELVGALQRDGLALEGLEHGLTRGAARSAREEAAGLALDSLRRRAEALAGQLNMRVERVAEIRVLGDAPPPRPMMAMSVARAAAAPPPALASEDAVVPATVEAVLVLAPR